MSECRTGLLAVVLSLTTWLPTLSAKPPDLPVTPKVNCEAVPNPLGILVVSPLEAIAAEEECVVLPPRPACPCDAVATFQRCLLMGLHPLLGVVPFGTEVDVEVSAVESMKSGHLVIGLGVNSDAGLVGDVVIELQPGQMPIGPGWWQIMMPFMPRVVSVYANDPETDVDVERIWCIDQPSYLVPSSASSGAEATCPYLMGPQPSKAAMPPTAEDIRGDVVRNLEKLERAEQVYRRAMGLQQAGRWDEARACYEEVRLLCPGSRYDDYAGAELKQMQARQTVVTTEVVSGEEQERAEKKAKAKKKRKVRRDPKFPKREVRGLERILIEGGEPGRQKLIVVVDEPATEEEQEIANHGAGLKKVHQALVDVLGSVACTEVECGPAGCRVRCEIRLGAMNLSLVRDRDGHGSLTLGWTLGTK